MTNKGISACVAALHFFGTCRRSRTRLASLADVSQTMDFPNQRIRSRTEKKNDGFISQIAGILGMSRFGVSPVPLTRGERVVPMRGCPFSGPFREVRATLQLIGYLGDTGKCEDLVLLSIGYARVTNSADDDAARPGTCTTFNPTPSVVQWSLGNSCRQKRRTPAAIPRESFVSRSA